MKRNITSLLCVLALSGAPAVADAQEMEPVENLKVDAYYQEWLADYEETGTKINEISETYQKEVDRRGYPKKKPKHRHAEDKQENRALETAV